MFINRKWEPALIVDDYFLSLPEIKDTIDEYKGRGLAVIIALFTRMIHLKGAIGVYKNLDEAARKLGMHKKTLIDIMKSSSAFVVDEKRKLFYSPCLRGILKLKPRPNIEELDDIAENGNIYLGWCKRHSRQKEYAMEKAERIKEKKLHKAEKMHCVEKPHLTKDTPKINNHIEKACTQDADNQAGHMVYKDKYISFRNILTTSNNALRNNIPPCSDDDDGNLSEKYFTCQKDKPYSSINGPDNLFSGINNTADNT